MFGGVFERFPDLQFVFTETGCAWIAVELRRLDGGVRMGKIKGKAAYPLFHRAVEALTLSPSEYFRRNCHVGVSLMVALGRRGASRRRRRRLMWGADYPHHEGASRARSSRCGCCSRASPKTKCAR